MNDDQFTTRLLQYRMRGIKLMNRIEEETGCMMSEVHPALEKAFWDASDAHNLTKLRSVYNQLTRLHDEATMDM